MSSHASRSSAPRASGARAAPWPSSACSRTATVWIFSWSRIHRPFVRSSSVAITTMAGRATNCLPSRPCSAWSGIRLCSGPMHRMCGSICCSARSACSSSRRARRSTSSSSQMVCRETPTRLLVYPISRELRQIANIVGDGLSVPQAAKAQLVEAIGAIAPLLPIHSDLPELAGHLDSIAADSTLYAHLLPLEAGLRLQLLVRPLASSSWFKPGHGLENVLGELDGKALQASRDLHAESASLQRVLQACPALAQADSDGQEWQLAEPQDALQVLSELQALEGDWLQCVWPEGERMRIKARPGMGQLRLGLKQQGDWFVLSGEVQLDDGRVLQLRQLLELLKSSPGRFLKLGEQDWLALSDSLRKRLDELAHLADRVGDDGLRLNLLTTPLLAGLAQEAGEFQADAGWQTHLDKLE